MKPFFQCCLFLVLLSCNPTGPVPKPNTQRLIGIYVGPFAEAPLTITITSVNDSTAYGFSRHLDIQRPLFGLFSFDGSYYRLKLSEPGDHPFDGTFLLRMDDDCVEAEGFWFPKDSSQMGLMPLRLRRKP